MHIGIRQFLLRKKIAQEAYEEVMEERSRPPVVEEYCTEYDSNYYMAGFVPIEETEHDKEVCILVFSLYRFKIGVSGTV